MGVAFGDINHDGKLDVGAASTAGIKVWTGNGMGAWAAALTGLPAFNSASIEFGDLNNDGSLDLVAGSWVGNGIQAWRGNGAGVWSAFPHPTASSNYYGLALGDINNDGQLDLAGGNSGGGVQVWTDTGRAEELCTWVSAPWPTSTGDWFGVDVGDVNNDGNLDIAAAGKQGVWIWGGDGGRSWTPMASPMTSGDVYGLDVGDINHDGWPDVLAGTVTHGLQLWAGNGGTAWTALPSPDTRSRFAHVDLGDFNNYGDLDILASDRDAGVKVWAGDGGRSWTPCTTGLPTTGKYYGAAWGHVDHDGALDLVVGHNNAGGVQVYTAAESAPPSGWSSFTPIGWQVTQQPTCTVQVSDAGSGLKVGTARYAFSTDGGTSWSAWRVASCTGTDGTTTTQTITAARVSFNQDSLTTTRWPSSNGMPPMTSWRNCAMA